MSHIVRWISLFALLVAALLVTGCRRAAPTPASTPPPPPPTALSLPTRPARTMTASPTFAPAAAAESTAIQHNPLATRTTPSPSSTAEEPAHIAGWAYVDILRTALRDAPAGEPMAALTAGQRLDILAATGDRAWLFVRWRPRPAKTPLEGWVRAADVRYFVDAQDIPVSYPGGVTPSPADNLGVVTARKLNLRAGPGIDHPILTQLHHGDQVQAIGRSDDDQWLKVVTAQGNLGWLAARWLSTDINLNDLPALGQATTAVPAPAPAPRGTIVFQDRPGGNIYILNADGSGLRTLTTGLDPALSPDGEQVAFVRWDGNGDAIRLINVDGSNERFFLGTNKPRSPTWSPDGSSIVYERIVEDRICRETPFGCLTDAQIRSKFDGNDCWTYPPPIGLLCIWDFPETHWQITDLEKFATTETGQVETLPTLQSAHSPYYHPAGGQVIHLTRKGLDIAYTDEDHPPESILLHPNLGAPIYSPDGQYIYISKKDGDNWDIWRYNADGSAPFALTHPPGLRDRPVNHVAPAVSPDGRHLLFLSDRNGFWQMWMMDSDGGHQRLFMPSILHDIQFQFDFGRARMIDWK